MHPRRAVLIIAVLALLLQLLVGGAAMAQTATVEVVDFDYRPRDIEVRPGTEVIFNNTGLDVHSVTALDGSFDFILNPGESGSVTFDEDGENPYYCKFHAEVDPESGQAFGMVGSVTVGPRELRSENLTAEGTIATAIAWSQHSFADGSTRHAFLGRDNLFADSLASGGAQGAIDAPLLLTQQTSLDPRVRAELDRLGVRTVHILGGETAVSAGVEQQLRTAGFGTRRVAGADRIGTAVDVASSFFPNAHSAILARGWGGADPTQAWADSLGGGAFAAQMGIPVLLSRTEALSGATRRYLEGPGRSIDMVFVAGGPSAVSEAVVDELEGLGIEVVRLGGAGRVQTAILVAVTASPEPPTSVSIIDGGNPDSWADGFAAASARNPVLLSSGNDLNDANVGLLASAGAIDVVCGTTVPAAACGQATAAAHYGDFPPSDDMILATAEGMGPSAFVLARPWEGSLCVSTLAFDRVESVTVTRNGTTVAEIGQTGWDAVLGFEMEDLYGCAFGLSAADAQGLADSPEDYEVAVTYDEGEVDGAFTPLTAAMLAGLSGDQETGDGAEDGLGFQIVLGTGNPDELCVAGFYMGIDDPTMAHIHEGERGEDGGIVVTLPTPMGGDGFYAMMPECVTEDEAGAVADIKADPDSYYVNVHTGDFPAGAIRGQLFSFMESTGGGAAAASFQAAADAAGSQAPTWASRIGR